MKRWCGIRKLPWRRMGSVGASKSTTDFKVCGRRCYVHSCICNYNGVKKSGASSVYSYTAHGWSLMPSGRAKSQWWLKETTTVCRENTSSTRESCPNHGKRLSATEKEPKDMLLAHILRGMLPRFGDLFKEIYEHMDHCAVEKQERHSEPTASCRWQSENSLFCTGLRPLDRRRFAECCL